MDLKELLQKYLAGTLSDPEKEYFENLVLKDSYRKELSAIIESEYLKEQGWEDVPPFEVLLSKINVGKPAKGKLAVLREKWFWAACAACIVFLLGGTWMGYQLRKPSDHAFVSFSTAATNPGQTARLTLSDGTQVLLAGNSSLSFPDHMNRNAIMYLDGEAYFDFVPATRKVQIRTNDITTITDDAKLNIRAFSKDSVVQVAVAEGNARIKESTATVPMMKIRMPSADSTSGKNAPVVQTTDALYVGANQQVNYDRNSKNADVTKFDGNIVPLFMLYPADYSSKPNGENLVIRFKEAKLTGVTRALTQKFNLEFELHVDGKELPDFSGTFNARENPLNILMHVCNHMKLRYEIKDGIIKIYHR